tara:strand:- start:90 stop:284 length:195 start_codon:yes stop_codon:yes gene_type:complete
MKPEDIELNSINGSFEFEKLSREIDTIGDLETCRSMLKAYVKLYIKQRETFAATAKMLPNDNES